MNQYEALGLSSEQVRKLEEIAATYTAAGRPTSVDEAAGRPASVDELVSLVFAPTEADFERLAKIRLPQQPWLRRIRWWLLDALDGLRRLFDQLWLGSLAIVCSEFYLGGGWEPEACEKCKTKESCQKMEER